MSVVSFKERRKKQLGIKSLGDQIRSGEVVNDIDPKLFIHGPSYMDCLTEKWSKRELMTVIGGSGVGKSSIALEIFRHILLNNDNPDSVVVFVSLEMTTQKIASRWRKMTADLPHLADRLYVISNYDENGKSRMLNTEDILNETRMIKEALEVDILSVCVDHLHIIAPTKGQGDDINKIAWRLKEIAVETNSFLIALAQTTKGKQGAYSDKPLDADAVYGASQLKWASSFMLSAHRPLGMLGDKALNCLAWGYVKVREKHPNDPLHVGVYQLLKYNESTGTLDEMSRDDMLFFNNQYSQVLELKQNMEEESDFALYNTKVDGKAISDREQMLESGVKEEDRKKHLI